MIFLYQDFNWVCNKVIACVDNFKFQNYFKFNILKNIGTTRAVRLATMRGEEVGRAEVHNCDFCFSEQDSHTWIYT